MNTVDRVKIQMCAIQATIMIHDARVTSYTNNGNPIQNIFDDFYTVLNIDVALKKGVSISPQIAIDIANKIEDVMNWNSTVININQKTYASIMG